MNSLDCYSYRIIGKLTVFFADSGVQLPEQNRGLFHFLRAAFSDHLKAKVGNTLDKDETLLINLSIDGESTTTRIRTQPSHSQTSRL